MKRYGLYVLIAVLVLGFAAFFASCGGGGGGGSAPATTSAPPPPTVQSTPTSMTTTTQGAQSASVGANIAQSWGSNSQHLTGTVGAPRFKIPFTSAKANPAIAKLTSKIKPAISRAKSLRSTIMSAATTSTFTENCNVSGTLSFTVGFDPTTGIYNFDSMSVSYNNCNDGFGEVLNGPISFSLSSNGTATTGTITMGTAATPFSDTTCKALSSTTYDCSNPDNVMTSATTITMTETVAGGATTEVLSITGWMKTVDNTVTPSTTDYDTFTNFSMTDVSSFQTATTASGTQGTFASEVMTLDGSVSTSHTETNNNFGESDTFQQFKITYLTDFSTRDYYSIDGKFAVAMNPADKCIDGTFSFQTITPLTVNLSTGDTVAGEIKINGNVDVVYSSSGVTVAVNNGTPVSYTDADLNALCAL